MAQYGDQLITGTIMPFIEDKVFGNVENDDLLKKAIGFNMVSVSPYSVIGGIVASITILAMVLIDRIFLKHKFKSPLQILALVLSISGLLYYAILGVILFL